MYAFDLWAKCRVETLLLLSCCCFFFIIILLPAAAAVAVAELVNKQPKPTRFSCFATLRLLFFSFYTLFMVLDLGLQRAILFSSLTKGVLCILILLSLSMALTMFATMWELFVQELRFCYRVRCLSLLICVFVFVLVFFFGF